MFTFKIKTVACYLKDQWFLLALGVLIAIASQVQVPASQQELKTSVVSYLCVSIIFLMTGCTLPTRTLIDNYSKWKVHLFVQLQCFLMTSAIQFGVVSLVAKNKDFMDPGLLIGESLKSSPCKNWSSWRPHLLGMHSHYYIVQCCCMFPCMGKVNRRLWYDTDAVTEQMTGQAHGNTALTGRVFLLFTYHLIAKGRFSCPIDLGKLSWSIPNASTDLNVHVHGRLVYQTRDEAIRQWWL